jgi:hypothetical protein
MPADGRPGRASSSAQSAPAPQDMPFAWGEAAPHAVVLIGDHGEDEAVQPYWAVSAHGSGKCQLR